MNCLYDYIGIKGHGSQESLSGLFINQLPGITLDSLEKVASTDAVNIAGVWKNVRDRASVRLEKDFRIALRSRFKLLAIKSAAIAKPDINLEETVAADAKYRGVVIDLGERKGSFLTIHVDTISITLTQAVESLVVKIFDRDGQELDTFTKANAIEGKNTIPVSKKYPSKVFISCDATAFPLYSSDYPSEVKKSCCACVCKVCDECEPKIYGAESLLDTPAATDTATSVFGFEISYGVMCDYSSIICSNKPEFIDVWMFCLGIEMMIERLYSNKLNKYTTIDKDQATELKHFYNHEYDKALKETINALELKEEDCCIECNPTIARRDILP
jgi:hypothetical protein